MYGETDGGEQNYKIQLNKRSGNENRHSRPITGNYIFSIFSRNEHMLTGRWSDATRVLRV